MINNLLTSRQLNKLISNHAYFVFVSPHLDDAVLSCANLMLKLRNKDVRIITVFTQGGNNSLTPQAKSFLKATGYNNPEKLFADRKIEDAKAAKMLNAKYQYLEFTDAAWRIKNNKPIYPDNRSQFSGNISRNDIFLIDKIKTKLLKIVPNNNDTVLFAPLGIGGHTDHVLINKVVRKLPHKKIFWEDFPYSLDTKCKKEFYTKIKDVKPFLNVKSFDKAVREAAIQNYKSQVKYLFVKNRIPIAKDVYYILKKDANNF